LAVADAIAPQEGDAFFTKELGDALTNPALREHLNSYEIRRLLISGIASDGCVQSTIYSAYRSGYEVVIVTDEHAHSDGEAVFAVQMNNLWLGRGLTGMPMSEIDWATFACLDESTESDTREEAEPSTEDQAPLGSPPGSNPIISKAGSGALSPVRCSALDHIGTCSGNLSADSRGIFTLDSVLIHASRAASWICVGFLLMLSAPIYTWSSHRQSETAVHKT
jgi:hypothetical protein